MNFSENQIKLAGWNGGQDSQRDFAVGLDQQGEGARVLQQSLTSEALSDDLIACGRQNSLYRAQLAACQASLEECGEERENLEDENEDLQDQIDGSQLGIAEQLGEDYATTSFIDGAFPDNPNPPIEWWQYSQFGWSEAAGGQILERGTVINTKSPGYPLGTTRAAEIRFEGQPAGTVINPGNFGFPVGVPANYTITQTLVTSGGVYPTSPPTYGTTGSFIWKYFGGV